MSDQLTFRLPRELARLLARYAREHDMARSTVVREALAQYLAGGGEDEGALSTWDRLAPFIGAVELDRAQGERDPLGRRIREQNWRE